MNKPVTSASPKRASADWLKAAKADNATHRIRVHEERSKASAKYSLNALDGETIWYEVVGDAPPPRPQTDDFALMSMLFIGMRNGVNLHLEGTVTEECIHNLYELQDIWTTWLPDDYRKIAFSADNVISLFRPMHRTGVFSFSGGVDSTAALTLNLDEARGERRIKPAATMIIQGFDVPIEEEAWFASADAHIRDMLSPYNVPHYVVRTNYRTVIKALFDARVWGYEAGPALFASFHLFSEIAGYGVMGGTEDLNHLDYPWGLGPITDYLYGNGRFHIRAGCNDLTRSQRVGLIADKQPPLAKKLRVCWERIDSEVNCGRCEKCVRTRLNFIAVCKEPVCFPGKLRISDLLLVKSFKNKRMGFIYEIVQTANENKISLKWRALIYLWLIKNLPLRFLWKIKNFGNKN